MSDPTPAVCIGMPLLFPYHSSSPVVFPFILRDVWPVSATPSPSAPLSDSPGRLCDAIKYGPLALVSHLLGSAHIGLRSVVVFTLQLAAVEPAPKPHGLKPL